MNDNNENNKLKIAIDNRKFEIELLWKRTLIFWGFISALFIAIAQLIKTNSSDYYVLILSITGMVFSIIWTLANRGSKAWQESWEIKAREYYKENEKNIYKKIYQPQDGIICILRHRDYSLSRLLIALSDFSVIIWLGISLFYLPGSNIRTLIMNNKEKAFNILFWFGIAYIIYVLIFCRSRDTGELFKGDEKLMKNENEKNLILKSYFKVTALANIFITFLFSLIINGLNPEGLFYSWYKLLSIVIVFYISMFAVQMSIYLGLENGFKKPKNKKLFIFLPIVVIFLICLFSVIYLKDLLLLSSL